MSASAVDFDIAVFHAVFGIVASAGLAAPHALSTGWRVLFLVLLYDVTLPAFALLRLAQHHTLPSPSRSKPTTRKSASSASKAPAGAAVAIIGQDRHLLDKQWLSIVTFVWPLSVFMLFPDWFLSAVLGVLEFTDDGAPRVDTINLAMAGMWCIPLFVSTYVGHRAAARRQRRLQKKSAEGAFVAGVTGLVIFCSSEYLAPTLGLWHPIEVGFSGQQVWIGMCSA